MVTARDQEEQDLRIEVMQQDLRLKQKQVAWETPRNIAILAGSVAAISAAVAGWIGYHAGREDASRPTIILPPGSTITTPSGPAPGR